MSEGSLKARKTGPFFWCVVAMLVLAVYAGAYFALATRLYSAYEVSTGGKTVTVYSSASARYSRDKFIDEGLTLLFYPLHAVDRIVRPDFWR